MENKNELIVPENVMQAVVNYLSGRPFSEVSNLITAIQASVRQYTVCECKTKSEEENTTDETN